MCFRFPLCEVSYWPYVTDCYRPIDDIEVIEKRTHRVVLKAET